MITYPLFLDALLKYFDLRLQAPPLPQQHQVMQHLILPPLPQHSQAVQVHVTSEGLLNLLFYLPSWSCNHTLGWENRLCRSQPPITPAEPTPPPVKELNFFYLSLYQSGLQGVGYTISSLSGMYYQAKNTNPLFLLFFINSLFLSLWFLS